MNSRRVCNKCTKRFTGKSISEIKEAIENENPVFKCESFSKGEPRKLLDTSNDKTIDDYKKDLETAMDILEQSKTKQDGELIIMLEMV